METNSPPSNGNSIVAGVSSLIVLIVIIVMVTSLLNNKSISALETRTEQLEINVKSLQLSPSLQPTVFSTNSEISDKTISEEPPEPMEVIENNSKFDIKTPKVMIAALNSVPLAATASEEPKIDNLANQIETINGKVNSVTNKVNAANSKIDSFSNKLDIQAKSLKSILKNETKMLAITQNNKIKKLETQLTSITKNISSLQREGKQLSFRAAQLESTGSTNQTDDSSIKLLTNKLQNLSVKINSLSNTEQVQKLDQKIDQQINKLKSSLEVELTKKLSSLEIKTAEQLKQQNSKIEVLETQLQMLIGGLTASSEK